MLQALSTLWPEQAPAPVLACTPRRFPGPAGPSGAVSVIGAVEAAESAVSELVYVTGAAKDAIHNVVGERLADGLLISVDSDEGYCGLVCIACNRKLSGAEGVECFEELRCHGSTLP